MADIWSFGCVVLEMGTASSPWGHPGNMKGQGKIDVIVQEPMMPPQRQNFQSNVWSKHFSVTFGFSLHYPPETASLGISALSGCFQPPRKFDNPMAAMQLARTYQSVNFAAKTDTGWMIAPFVSHHVELSFTSQGIRSVCPMRRHPFQSTSPISTAASFIDACKEILTRGCVWWFFLCLVVVFALVTWVCLSLSCVILVDFLFLASSVLVCFVVFLVGIISVAVCVWSVFVWRPQIQ